MTAQADRGHYEESQIAKQDNGDRSIKPPPNSSYICKLKAVNYTLISRKDPTVRTVSWKPAFVSRTQSRSRFVRSSLSGYFRFFFRVNDLPCDRNDEWDAPCVNGIKNESVADFGPTVAHSASRTKVPEIRKSWIKLF